jgi:thiol-disulfide isomerase/thioredoxin
MRRTFLVAILVFIALISAPFNGRGAAQEDTERDLREATFTAEEIFRLADERKFNAMYDRIHPDAHAVIPRAAAVGTFEELYAIFQAERSEIVDVQFGSWEWAVTGETYPYAAQVAFEQPYVDLNGREQLLEDTMYLVKSDGEWRWFFGASMEFVETQIERFGGRGTPLTEGDLLENVVNDLDTFYRDVLSYTEFEYYSPKVVVVGQGEAVNTGCGPAQSGFWAFYCPPGQTIYLDDPLMASLEQEADFAVAFVIAHEWAHHVQTGVGIQRTQYPTSWNEVYSIDLELMADCLSGAWALDVDTRGLLETDDIDEAMQFTAEYLGDPAHINEHDPQAHGTADQRVQSFLNGYENGFLGCNVLV